jgi:hypothetical protein
MALWWTAAATAAVALALSASAAAAAGTATLPDRVAAPAPWTNSVDDDPAGPASVIFTGPSWWYDGSMGRIAVVGATSDGYRLLHDGWGLDAGEAAVLSPDGSRVAIVDRVVDLTTGADRHLPALDAEFVVPQAWSRRGDLLAVIGYDAPYRNQPDGAEVPTVEHAVLHVIDVDAGSAVRIAELDPRNVRDGWTVAFAPDGTRLAYQSGDQVVVAGVDGRTIARFAVDPGVRLAGKGAWTPGGELTLVRHRLCCAGEANPFGWRLEVVDPLTGAVVRHVGDDVTGATVRLLGWSGLDTAVIAEYGPTSVHVFALHPGEPPETLLTGAADAMTGVDLSDDVIASGLTRRANPPAWSYLTIVGRIAGIVGVLVVVASVLVAASIWFMGQKRGRRSRITPIMGGQAGPR